MAQAGYIYVLFNPSASGIVKIGKTQRSPDERAKELSSATGVPTPFVVIYQNIFQDCDEAELFVHTKLDKYRVSNNREFFQLPIHLAIDTVLEAKKFFEKTNNIFEQLGDLSGSDDKNSHDDFLNSLTLDDSKKPSDELFETAESYFYGRGDTIQDYDEAINLYQKAARLGSSEAFLQIGRIYQRGLGRPSDKKRALEFFKEGIKHGNDTGWAEMAEVFYLEGRRDNEEKCWSKYFSSDSFSSSDTFSNFGIQRRFAIYTYVLHSILLDKPIVYKEQIIQFRNEVLEMINQFEDTQKKVNASIEQLELTRKCLMAIKELS